MLSGIAEMMLVLHLYVIQHHISCASSFSHFLFYYFFDEPFPKGFHRKLEADEAKMRGLCAYFVKYLRAVSSLTVSSHGIASFHLKSKVSACITYFLSKNTQYERWVESHCPFPVRSKQSHCCEGCFLTIMRKKCISFYESGEKKA